MTTPSKHLGAVSDLHPDLVRRGLKHPLVPRSKPWSKWYNADKGFGFVQLADGSGDAFLHVSVVERGGHGSIPPGATLEVRAGPGPRGHR